MGKGRRTAFWTKPGKNDKRSRTSGNLGAPAQLVSTGTEKKMLTPYHLPIDSQQKLLGFSDADCYQCKGTGVREWRNEGMSAVICRCVKRELARRQTVFDQTQSLLLEQLMVESKVEVAALKASGEAAPSRPCTLCQESRSENTGEELKLVVVHEECQACNSARTIPLTDVEWARLFAYRRYAQSRDKLESYLQDRQKKADEIAKAVLKDAQDDSANRPEAVLAAPAG